MNFCAFLQKKKIKTYVRESKVYYIILHYNKHKYYKISTKQDTNF